MVIKLTSITNETGYIERLLSQLKQKKKKKKERKKEKEKEIVKNIHVIIVCCEGINSRYYIQKSDNDNLCP